MENLLYDVQKIVNTSCCYYHVVLCVYDYLGSYFVVIMIYQNCQMSYSGVQNNHVDHETFFHAILQRIFMENKLLK